MHVDSSSLLNSYRDHISIKFGNKLLLGNSFFDAVYVIESLLIGHLQRLIGPSLVTFD